MSETECLWCGAYDEPEHGIEVGIATESGETVCNICLQDGYRSWEIDPSDGQWTAWAKRQMDDRPPAELAPLVNGGLSTAEALDYYMVEMGPHTQTSWARIRGKDQSTISENVSKARGKLAV